MQRTRKQRSPSLEGTGPDCASAAPTEPPLPKVPGGVQGWVRLDLRIWELLAGSLLGGQGKKGAGGTEGKACVGHSGLGLPSPSPHCFPFSLILPFLTFSSHPKRDV